MTPEQIAKETAEALAEAAPGGQGVFVSPAVYTASISAEQNEARLLRVREHLADGVLAALRRYALTPPCTSPVSAERLAEIAGKVHRYREWRERNGPTRDGEEDLLQALCDYDSHLAFLHRVMDGPEAALLLEAERRGYARGFAAGAEAQKAIDGPLAASAAIVHSRDGYAEVVAYNVSKAVADAPLARPSEED